MTMWKVYISGTQRPVLDLDQLLGAVLALGRQLAEEERRRQLREARKALDRAGRRDRAETR